MIPGESNLPAITSRKKVRVYGFTTKRLMTNYAVFCRLVGYNTTSDALRWGIRGWIEGSLELGNIEINENILHTEEELKKLHGDKLVKWKHDNSDFEIRIDEHLLKNFDEKIKNSFKRKNRAIKAIMFTQILKWRQLYGEQGKL